MAEDLLHGRVGGQHDAFRVDGDDGVWRGFDHGLQALLGGPAAGGEAGLPHRRFDEHGRRTQVLHQTFRVPARSIPKAHHGHHAGAVAAGQTQKSPQRRVTRWSSARPQVEPDVVGDQRLAFANDFSKQRIEVAEHHALGLALLIQPARGVVPGNVGDRVGAQEAALVVFLNAADEAVLAARVGDQRLQGRAPPAGSIVPVTDQALLEAADLALQGEAEPQPGARFRFFRDVARGADEVAVDHHAPPGQQTIAPVAGEIAVFEEGQRPLRFKHALEPLHRAVDIVRMNEGADGLRAQCFKAKAQHPFPGRIQEVEVAAPVDGAEQVLRELEQLLVAAQSVVHRREIGNPDHPAAR